MTHRLLYIIIGVGTLLCACGYDETLDVLQVQVQLGFPSAYDGSRDGIRVELTDATASTFVDSTDAQGMAHFVVPPGIYAASSSSQKLTTDYRYLFNGTKSRIVVASDSANRIHLPLTMSRKRIVH